QQTRRLEHPKPPSRSLHQLFGLVITQLSAVDEHPPLEPTRSLRQIRSRIAQLTDGMPQLPGAVLPRRGTHLTGAGFHDGARWGPRLTRITGPDTKPV